jgi:hypothetical protein
MYMKPNDKSRMKNSRGNRLSGFAKTLQLEIILGLFLLGACAYGTRMRLSNDPVKAKRQILRVIPLGTPAKIAEAEMRSLGYDCQYEKGDFDDQISSQGESGLTKPYENIAFLNCVRPQTDFFIIDRLFIIGLVCGKDHIITNVLVQVYLHDYF